MDAKELADKFTAKIAVAAVEKDRQTGIAADNAGKRTAGHRALQESNGTACDPVLGRA
jgi:hypothetical protein